jgi:selenide,water dikinase
MGELSAHELVLVGGGHAHVQVLRGLAMRPLPGARVTLVVDDPVAVYSGMVPGFVAGHYRRDELEIDVRPLARRAGASVVVARATGVLASEQRIELEGRAPIHYDTASFDVGSTVAGLDLPGARDFALATRPIGRFVAKIDAAIARLKHAKQPQVVVCGAGAGGVELAFALRARLAREGVRDAAITLVDAASRLLPSLAARVGERAAIEARARGLALRMNTCVVTVEEGALVLEAGERIPFDALIWATGAASQSLFAASSLPTGDRGFVRVRATLQVEAHDALFAVGDCARFEPDLPKAGVYAVRQGPLLDRNLRAHVTGGVLHAYRPQRDFLVLLNLGDGAALGTKWGRTVVGPRVFAWKDRIDRRFAERFQVLAPDGAPARAFPPMEASVEMLCGGCAAKVGESVLHRALARLAVRRDDAVVLGLEAPDDAAAVLTTSGELVVASVDAFRPFTDDPFLVGRVAAVNAASDLWAKGASPRFALAQVTLPGDDDERVEELLFQVLIGARAALDAEGIALVGGHTTAGDELQVGFSIWGDAPAGAALLRLGGLAHGDRLILTKPLGTGVLWNADMRGLARGAWIEAAIASMLRSNAAAARVARDVGASACTDVSGFGFAGHLGSLLRASGASARIALDAIPLLPGVASCFGRGLRSTFHAENEKARRALRIEPRVATRPEVAALFDPQTSGGLLFGVAAKRADEAIAKLHAAGDVAAACVGVVELVAADGALFTVADAI